MRRVVAAMVCMAVLGGCGIKRPLIAPKDIPAYEESLRKKHEQIVQQQADIDQANADKSAVTPALQGTK